MDVPPKHRRAWSLSDIEELKSMLRRKMNRKEIARLLGRTEQAVETKLYHLHVARTARGVSGKAQRRRKSGASFFLS